MSNSYRAGGAAWSDDSMRDSWSFLPGAVPEDPDERNKFLNYHVYNETPKHRLRWNWIADLPFGKGKPVAGGAGPWLNRLIGGWQLAGYGSMAWNYWELPASNWGYLGDIEVYGKKYPIQDCRSGRCNPGYLFYNGYIPANRINSYDANGKPNGVMGVPANYKPSNLPVWPWPADGGNVSDPNYRFLGTNTVFVPLKDGSSQQVAIDNGLHPWRNQFLLGPRKWSMDASLFKAVQITERTRLRVNADFFNVFNLPGINSPAAATGIISQQTSSNAARQLQLTLRLIW